jgi:hypothetical protein
VAGSRARAGVVAEMLARIRRNRLRLLSAGTLVIGLLYVLVAWGSASQIEPYQQGWVVAYPVVLFVQQTVGWLALASIALLISLSVWRSSKRPPPKLSESTPTASRTLLWLFILCILFTATGVLTVFETVEHKAMVSFHERAYVMAIVKPFGSSCCQDYLVVLACDNLGFLCRAEWQSSICPCIYSDFGMIADESANKLYARWHSVIGEETVEVPIRG